MNELSIIDEYFDATLGTDSTLTALVGGATNPRIGPDSATRGSAYPLVTWHLQTPYPDVVTAGQQRAMVRSLWAVKAVHETRDWHGVIKTIADRIDELLHASHGDTPSGRVLTCTRDSVLRYPEVTGDGHEYRHLGGLYLIEAQAAS